MRLSYEIRKLLEEVGYLLGEAIGHEGFPYVDYPNQSELQKRLREEKNIDVQSYLVEVSLSGVQVPQEKRVLVQIIQ